MKAEFGLFFSTEELSHTEDQANSSVVSCLEWMKTILIFEIAWNYRLYTYLGVIILHIYLGMLIMHVHLGMLILHVYLGMFILHVYLGMCIRTCLSCCQKCLVLVLPVPGSVLISAFSSACQCLAQCLPVPCLVEFLSALSDLLLFMSCFPSPRASNSPISFHEAINTEDVAFGTL